MALNSKHKEKLPPLRCDVAVNCASRNRVVKVVQKQALALDELEMEMPSVWACVSRQRENALSRFIFFSGMNGLLNRLN